MKQHGNNIRVCCFFFIASKDESGLTANTSDLQKACLTFQGRDRCRGLTETVQVKFQDTQCVRLDVKSNGTHYHAEYILRNKKRPLEESAKLWPLSKCALSLQIKDGVTITPAL